MGINDSLRISRNVVRKSSARTALVLFQSKVCQSMENLQSAVDSLVHSSNTLFILIGAVMVLAMHAGFAFLEVGTVRQLSLIHI